MIQSEAVHRAAAETDRSTDNESKRLMTESLEQILPQLLLDF